MARPAAHDHRADQRASEQEAAGDGTPEVGSTRSTHQHQIGIDTAAP
jgi:hypothetical protein